MTQTLHRLKCFFLRQDAASHSNLGAILHINNKLDEAERSYKNALRLQPDDATTLANLRKLKNVHHRRHTVKWSLKLYRCILHARKCIPWLYRVYTVVIRVVIEANFLQYYYIIKISRIRFAYSLTLRTLILFFFVYSFVLYNNILKC